MAAVFDQLDPRSPITALQVEGASDSPSTLLLASWLHRALDVPITVTEDAKGTGIRRVVIERVSGNVELHRPNLVEAILTQPGQPSQQVSLPRRTLQDCLAEELRRLDPDEVFGEVVTEGMEELLKDEKVVSA